MFFLLPNAISKSHIARLLREWLAKNLQEKLLTKEGSLQSEICAQRLQKIVETAEVEKARRASDRVEAAELKKENARIAALKKLWKQLHKELKAGGCRITFGGDRHD